MTTIAHDIERATATVDCDWCTALAGDPCRGAVVGHIHASRVQAYRLHQRASGMTVLPYAGTSGHSGSATSESRARTEDANGTTSDRQQRTMSLLLSAGVKGMTVHELCDATGWHHGQASAALTNLHKGGRIHRLTEKRSRCKVYVSLTCAARRNTERPGQNKGKGQRTFERGHLRPVNLYCVQDRLDRVWVIDSTRPALWWTTGEVRPLNWSKMYYPLREVVLTWGEEKK